MNYPIEPYNNNDNQVVQNLAKAAYLGTLTVDDIIQQVDDESLRVLYGKYTHCYIMHVHIVQLK
jgi:hypothetical protein